MGRTLLDKIWDAHTVRTEEGGRTVLYIDRQYIHEVTSPVAFGGIERRGLGVARPAQITATADHNIPTVNQHLPIEEPESRRQVEALAENCARHGIEHFGVGHPKQGIVHIIGPELGFTQPGMTIVCGDSHTSTHGALGAVAFGVGTSEVEMVFASQCILQTKPRSMRITVDGELRPGVEAKDVILYIISQITASGGTAEVGVIAGVCRDANVSDCVNYAKIEYDGTSAARVSAAMVGFIFSETEGTKLERLQNYGAVEADTHGNSTNGGNTAIHMAGICGFALPSRDLSDAVRLWRFLLTALGGIAGGVVGMVIFRIVFYFCTLVPLHIGWCVVIGLAGALMGELGDLSFSVIKRQVGIKDYGRLLPGHGGVLDRFDSVLFAAPMIWMIVCTVQL